MPAAAPDTKLDLFFAGEPFSLTGFSLQSDHVQAGEDVLLTRFWHASGPAQYPYTIFTHLTDDSGNLLAQKDSWPVNGQWPPTCWQSGEQIIDQVIITLPPDLPAGSYILLTGLYDSQTGARVPLVGGSDSVILGSIRVSEP